MRRRLNLQPVDKREQDTQRGGMTEGEAIPPRASNFIFNAKNRHKYYLL